MITSNSMCLVRSFFSRLKEKDKTGIVFRKNFNSPDFSILIRPLTYDDLDTIYEWVNLPYAKRFWQMDGPKGNLLQSFEQVLKSEHAHSLLGLINDQPICQVDLYHVLQDEVSCFYNAAGGDIGMHLLMAPKVGLDIRYLSLYVMQTMLGFLFSHPFIENVVAEPDASNIKACQLLDRARFTFMGNFSMSSKVAAVYILNKKKYML